MLNLNHKKLKAWQLAIQLYKEVLLLVRKLPKEEIFNLTSQIKRAALSVSNNIAEGAARKSSAERKRFYEVARSSDVEVDNCFEVILTVEYLSKEDILIAENLVEQIFKLLSAMIDNTK
ncbi:four helix bundle protein [soil metagenome]